MSNVLHHHGLHPHHAHGMPVAGFVLDVAL
jgi:hypothetical protein